MKITLQNAIELLKSDQIAAVPTETVYGLAARYDSEKAIQAIFQTKNRPLDHPLIVHVGSIDTVFDLAIDIKPYVIRLIEAFWPGPLTLVLKKQKTVSNLITANQDTVAIRMPNHPLMLDLINQLGVPVVAPSANPFCKTSPTTAEHVEHHFLSELPVLDGGPCEVGIESTIILATEEDSLTLLRPGILSKTQIEKVANIPFKEKDLSGIKAPGKKEVHYQPNVMITALESDDFLDQGDLEKTDQRLFIMSFNAHNLKSNRHTICEMPQDPLSYSQHLYEKWHSVSQAQFDQILVELPPKEDRWQGIRDRIIKAAS